MRRRRNDVQIRVDWYTRLCLTVIAVLLTVLIVALWADRAPDGRQAVAKDVFDPSKGQRSVVVTAMEKNTSKLAEIAALLRSGQVKVQVVSVKGALPGGANAEPKKPKEK